MAYGEFRRSLVETIASTPGLTTGQLYTAMGAETLGNQSNVRQAVRALFNRGELIRKSITLMGNDGFAKGRTFAYFPATTAGRAAMRDPVTPAIPTVKQVQKKSATSTTSTTRHNWKDMPSRIKAILTSSQGLTTDQLYPLLGATTAAEKAKIRPILQVLAETKQVLRTKVPGSGGGRGAVPFTYFAKTPENRQVIAEIGSATGKRTSRKTRFTERKAPATTFARRTTNGASVEAVVRITLPDGPHEVSFDHARTLKDELTDLFA